MIIKEPVEDDVARDRIIEWLQKSKDLKLLAWADLEETTKPGDEWVSHKLVRYHFKIEGSITAGAV